MRNLLLIVLVFSITLVQGQELKYAQTIVDTLASDYMAGRGYVNKGDLKAAEFIRGEYRAMQLSSISGDYFQHFSFPMNTIEGEIIFELDGKQLEAGNDFTIPSSAVSCNKTYELVWLSYRTAKSERRLQRFVKKNNLKTKIVVVDPKIAKKKKTKEIFKALSYSNPLGSAGVIIPKKKLIWSVSDGRKTSEFLKIQVKESLVNKNLNSLKLVFESTFHEKYKSQNVIGILPGTKYPNKFIAITAHYDHLGMMGPAIFRGANDNASGVAMMLDLMRYFKMNPPEYSIIFMAFSGEEAGLLGSTYFVQNPEVNLEDIAFLINLDMVGTGSDGITIVNGKTFEKEANYMDSLNVKHNMLVEKIAKRGESAHSDHHPFYKAGVPAVFIYTRGKEHLEYHNVNDLPQDLPLTDYVDVASLIRIFIENFDQIEK